MHQDGQNCIHSWQLLHAASQTAPKSKRYFRRYIMYFLISLKFQYHYGWISHSSFNCTVLYTLSSQHYATLQSLLILTHYSNPKECKNERCMMVHKQLCFGGSVCCVQYLVKRVKWQQCDPRNIQFFNDISCHCCLPWGTSTANTCKRKTHLHITKKILTSLLLNVLILIIFNKLSTNYK